MSHSGKQTHLPGEASISVRGDRNQEARSFMYSGALAQRGVDQGPRRQESGGAYSVTQWQTNALPRRGVDQCPRRQESGGA